ncbi:MAG: UDP-glucose 4-epimerase GalE [Candidatus Omnitrophota bacterium]|nr:UDP-glucose 4-epimerase GalE [Candidatus Omnitrophota bacterium]
MLNIKKILLIRVISLLLSISVALPDAAYSLSESLRVPLNTPELKERQEEVQRFLTQDKATSTLLSPTVLVTGGAGYIGNFVVRQLRSKGYNVIIYDRATRPELALEKLKYIQGDLGDRKRLDEVFKAEHVNAVIHLAALIQVPESVRRPAAYYENNFINTLALLDTMAKHRVRSIVFSSSAAVYGEGSEELLTEQTNVNPANPYGETKWLMEEAMRAYEKRYGIHSVALRYFNAAGAAMDGSVGEAHQPETHIIPSLLEKAVKKREKLPIRRGYPTPDGTAIRDFVHVEDLARAHTLALDYIVREQHSDIFNLGTGSGTSVREIVESIERLTGEDVPIELSAPRSGGVARLVASFTKAQARLGWMPILGIEQILESALKWHSNRPIMTQQQGENIFMGSHGEAQAFERVISQLRSNFVIGDSLREEVMVRLAKRMQVLLKEADQADAEEILRVIFASNTWLVSREKRIVNDQELMALLAKSLAISLRREDAKEIAEFLNALLNHYPENLLPEAKRLIHSYLVVYNIDRPLKIATVVSRYGGQIRILRPENHPLGENNLRLKLEQLEELYGINTNVYWELILVQDGDDRKPEDPLRRLRTIDMDRDIVLVEHPDYFASGRVRLYELDQQEKLRLGSVRTGATTYGARQAIRNGADFVVITDGDVSAHIGQEGLLLEPQLKGEKIVAVGSRSASGSIVRGRKLIRRIISPGFNIFSRLFLSLGPIRDTQCGFKAYSRQVLEDILPVNKDNRFDIEFAYNFSGEVNLLWRARLSGYQLKEIPIAWFDTPTTTVKRSDIINMAKGVLRQRAYLDKWKKRTPSGQETETISLPGSTKAWDLQYRIMPIEEKIKVAMSKYDLGVASFEDIRYEELRGGVPNRLPLRLETPLGNFALKQIALTLEEARFCVSVLRRLQKEKLPIPALVKTKDFPDEKTDSYFIKIGTYFYILEEFKEGRYVDRLQAEPAHFYSIGKIMADIHHILAGFTPEGQKTAAPVIDILRHRREFQQLRGRLRNRETLQLKAGEILFLYLYEEIMQQFDILENNLSESIYNSLPRVVVHGDASFPNILFSDTGEVVALLDWERSRIQPRVEDFKNTIMTVDPIQGRTYDFDSLVELVAAYQAHTADKLTEAELRAIPEVLRATFLWEFASRFMSRISELEQKEGMDRLDNMLLKFQSFKKDFPGTNESIQRFIKEVNSKSREILIGPAESQEPVFEIKRALEEDGSPVLRNQI